MRINIFHYIFSGKKANEVLNRKLDAILHNQCLTLDNQLLIISNQKTMAKKVSDLGPILDRLTGIVTDVKTEVGKVSDETQKSLDMITELKDVIANQDVDLPAEVSDKIDNLETQLGVVKDSIKAVDDKIPDDVITNPGGDTGTGDTGTGDTPPTGDAVPQG